MLAFSFGYAKWLKIDTNDSYDLQQYLQYAKTPTPVLSPLEINASQWSEDSAVVEGSNHLYNPYWIKLSLHNTTPQAKEFALRLNSLYFSKATLFSYEDSTLIESHSAGIQAKKGWTFADVPNVTFVRIQAHQKLDVYMAVYLNNTTLVAPYQMLKKSLYDHQWHYFLLFEGIFIGVFAIIILTSLLHYLFSRESLFVYYALYVSTLGLYYLMLYGLVGFGEYIELFTSWIGCVAWIFLLLYFSTILDLKSHLPRFNRYFVPIYIGLLIALEVLSLVGYVTNNILLMEYRFSLTYILYPILPAVALTISIYLASKKIKLANYFVITWALVSLSTVVDLSVTIGWIEDTDYYAYWSQFSYMVETLLFALILAIRHNDLQKAKTIHLQLIAHQNRLVSMGEMIHNIAHQWRQPLASINSTIFAIDSALSKNNINGDFLEHDLMHIEDITQYLSQTIDDFMGFLSQNKIKKHFYLKETILKVLSILQLEKQSINVTLKLDSDATLLGYPSELIQVLMSILNNAKDAFEINKIEDREITIATQTLPQSIKLLICDNAKGVPASIVEKIFNPYFSTKQKQSGQGLGLYIVKLIVEESIKGNIKAYNKDDGFCIEISITKEI